MMRIVKHALYALGYLGGFVMGRHTVDRLAAAERYLYAGWLRRALGTLGADAVICRPLHLSNGKRVFIGERVFIGRNVVLQPTVRAGAEEYAPSIMIGDDCNIMSDVHIASIGRLTIGNHVTIATRVFISDAFHGKSVRTEMDSDPMKRELYSKGDIVIEDCVWIGVGCVIMPGVRIGRGSVVGANSVVTKNIPPYSVAVGSPAKIIR